MVKMSSHQNQQVNTCKQHNNHPKDVLSKNLMSHFREECFIVRISKD